MFAKCRDLRGIIAAVIWTPIQAGIIQIANQKNGPWTMETIGVLIIPFVVSDLLVYWLFANPPSKPDGG